jgi:hypothetical protein
MGICDSASVQSWKNAGFSFLGRHFLQLAFHQHCVNNHCQHSSSSTLWHRRIRTPLVCKGAFCAKKNRHWYDQYSRNHKSSHLFCFIPLTPTDRIIDALIAPFTNVDGRSTLLNVVPAYLIDGQKPKVTALQGIPLIPILWDFLCQNLPSLLTISIFIWEGTKY